MAIADGVDNVRAAVREELRQGADAIKIMVSGGVASPYDPLDSRQFSLGEIAAAVEEAHAFNRYVLAHAYTPEAITRAVSQGVRTIEHGNLIDQPAARLLAKSKGYMIANLVAYVVMKERAAQFGMSADMLAKNDMVLEAGLRSLEICKKAGVKVGYGSDLLGQLQNEQSREFLLRSEVMTPIEIVRSATTIAAEIIRMEGKLGVVAARRLRRSHPRRRRPAEEPQPVPETGRASLDHHEGGAVPQKSPRVTGARPEGPCLMPIPTHRARSWRRLALDAAALASLAFILVPLVFVTWLAFFKQEIPSFPPEGYTLHWFSSMLTQKAIIDGFVTSAEVGLVATLIGLALGVPAALGLVRHLSWWSGAASTLLLMPLVVPAIVLGTAIYVAEVEAEILVYGFGIETPVIGTIGGLIAAHALIVIPWVVRLVTASLVGFDRSIEEAAQNLGATPFVTLRRVTLAGDPARRRRGGALRLRHLLQQSRAQPLPRRAPGGPPCRSRSCNISNGRSIRRSRRLRSCRSPSSPPRCSSPIASSS